MSNFVNPVYRAAVTTGTSLAAGTASVASLLPTDQNGTTPRVCLFQALNSTGAHLALGITTTATTATTSHLFLTPTPIALITRGLSAFAAIRDVSTQACTVICTPVEDG